MNTTRVHPERVYHPDQSQNIAGLHDCIREYKHRVKKLEREVRVLNAMIRNMRNFIIYEECNTDFRRIAEQEVK